MKKITTSLTLLLILCSHSAFASDKIFQKYANQVLKATAKPTKMITESAIFILHPMVKQKESRYLFTSTLRWKGKNCTAQVTSLKTLKGKEPRKSSSLKKVIKHHYIPKKLKALLTKAAISNWKRSTNIELEKGTYSGYRFLALIDGVKRNAALCIEKGKLKAIVYAFTDKGISHAKNMQDSGTIWYFNNWDKNIKLFRIFKITAKKSNGIPFVKKEKTVYSNF